MHTYAPFTKLFLHNVYSVVITANGHVHVIDSSTGSIVPSTTMNAGLAEKIEKSGEIVAASVDGNFKHLVTATSNKIIRVWNLPELCVISEREAPKKPTDVCFTHDAQFVLASDKFGDVHRYPRDSQSNIVQEATVSSSSNTKETKRRLTDETLLLGHVSLLTALLLSKDDRYIITADRDEHIRVSWYPEAYTIESYCLGHKKFVSSLHIPTWEPSLLISGGGDPVLKVWSWLDGKLLYDIPVGDVVMPFVKVVRKKPSRGEDGSDGEGGEGAPRISSRAKRRNRKRKDKGKLEPKEAPHSDSENDGEERHDEMEVDERHSAGAAANPLHAEGSNLSMPSDALPLLAIQKISALEFESSKLIIFSAHGATALFYGRFPDSADSSPEIRSISLGQPVLDFAHWPNGDEIWVAVDGNWSEDASSAQSDPKFIRIVKFVDDQLVIADDSAHELLAKSLNTSSRIEVSEESLNAIDLYSPLVVLPKNLDAEHNAMDSEVQVSEANSKQLSGKELGRLQTKKAVLALQASGRNEREQSSTPREIRSIKRQKSDSEGNVE